MRAKDPRINLVIAILLIFSGLAIIIIGGLGSLTREKTVSKNDGSKVVITPEGVENLHAINLVGESVSFSDYEGKVVVVNFWATWCGPCRLEMTLLDKYNKKYQDDLVLIAVNFMEPTKRIEEFVTEMGISVQVLLDPNGDINQLFKVRSLPTTFFLDENGVKKIQHVGLINEEQLRGYLIQLEVLQ